MRMTRSTVLEVLREDYVRTAWAKGLGGRIVVYKHALKNALIPVVTIVGGQLGTLLAGTVVVETIFALPGMGRLTVEAILFRDYPVVQTNVMLVAGDARHAESAGGSDVRVARSAHPVPVTPLMSPRATARVADVRGARSSPPSAGPSASGPTIRRKPLGRGSAALIVVHRAHGDLRGRPRALRSARHPAGDPPGARPAARIPSAPTTSAATCSAASSTAAASRCGSGCSPSASARSAGMVIGLALRLLGGPARPGAPARHGRGAGDPRARSWRWPSSRC